MIFENSSEFLIFILYCIEAHYDSFGIRYFALWKTLNLIWFNFEHFRPVMELIVSIRNKFHKLRPFLAIFQPFKNEFDKMSIEKQPKRHGMDTIVDSCVQ